MNDTVLDNVLDVAMVIGCRMGCGDDYDDYDGGDDG